MRHIVQAVVLLSLSGIPVFAIDACQEPPELKQGQAVTLQGEVLDLACYMAHEGRGPEHQTCAQTCLQGGGTAGLLTTDGKVYLLLEDHVEKSPYSQLRSLGARQVKVTGKLFERGKLQAVVLKTVKEL